MATLVRPGQRGMLPELFDWLESPPATLRPQQMIRFEESPKTGATFCARNCRG